MKAIKNAPKDLTWGWRVTAADLTSSNGYRWPFPGEWAECDPKGKPHTIGDPCPAFVGDGLCIALTPAGAASGGTPLHTCLLVGYREADWLGQDCDKVRVRRAYVAEVFDAWPLVMSGTSADLMSADLTYANLRYANLTYANLTSANLTSADLMSADLRYANLTYANLRYANLTYANLTSADLRYADLRYANLTYADLTYADLTYAVYDEFTGLPRGFDPVAARMIKRHEA